MKKFLIIAGCFVVFTLGGVAAVAASPGDKPPSPPGQGKCEHGNSQKPCKDDPQPDHGKDCEEHGPNEGGVNEDHCNGDETQPPTTTEPPPTTTEPPTVPTETIPTTPVPTTPTPPCIPKNPDGSLGGKDGKPGNDDCAADETIPTTTTPQSPIVTEVTPPTTVVPPVAVSPPIVTKETLEEQVQKQAQKNGANSNAPVRAQRAEELPNTGLPLLGVVLMGFGLVGSGLKLRRM